VLHALPDLFRSVAAFAVVLGVLVFIHEFGHYAAARLLGVHVEAFSIGFGRALAGWTDRAGTHWKLGWLPLGGYVKLHGQERPENVPEEERLAWRAGQTFQEKAVWRRIVIVAAGPLANFLLAAVLFAVLFATAGQPVASPVVGEVMSASAAERAGLLKGDKIDIVDGEQVRRFEDIQRIIVARPGVAIPIILERGGETMTVTAEPEARDNGGGRRVGVLGIRAGSADFVRLGPLQALAAGAAQTWEVTRQTFDSIWDIFAGRRGTDELGGPLRIAQLSGQVAQLGIANLITFIAVLSVNLGLLNLFPIPVLDGGHIVFFTAEGLLGRPLPARAHEYGFRAGLAVLLALFVFATWNDLTHLGIFRWVAGLIG